MSLSLNPLYLGLSQEELNVYKALLRSPDLNISELALTLKMSRTTLYGLISSLKEKGLLLDDAHKRAKSKLNTASPEKLLDFAKEYQQKSAQQVLLLEKELPILRAMSAQEIDDPQQEVFIFTGPNAIDEVDKLACESSETLLGFTYEYHIEACFVFDEAGELKSSPYLELLYKVGDKFVFPGDDSTIQACRDFLKKNPSLEGKWQPRWIEKENLPFNVNLYCFDDKVIFSQGNPGSRDYLAYLIKNAKIAHSMKSLSAFMWTHAYPIR